MRTLPTLRPTQTQLQVLSKIIASQNVPLKAAADISIGANMVAARNMLMKLNLITYSPKAAALTEIGQQFAREQDIVDNSGQLTPIGNKLAMIGPDGKPLPQDQVALGADMGSTGGMGELPPMESFSDLFKNIING